ncbi:MAG: conjugative transposon protein TraM [Sphingobacteriaceae bacterium]|nr:MAG: conjugative transposon protein TraM [Sphingobacteriaceae bacterium]
MTKIIWKQPKYVIPILALPFVLFIGFRYNSYREKKELAKVKTVKQETISTNLGSVENSEIKGKSDAYQEFFDKRTDGRTMIGGMDDEVENTEEFGDNLSNKEKRYIDSVNYIKNQSRLTDVGKQARNQQRFYSQDEKRKQADRKRDDDQYDRSMKMLEMLNGDKAKQANGRPQAEPVKEKNVQEDQISLMRSQMMLMDSIEKSNNPALKEQAEANQRLKQNDEELKMFLNSTLKVSKSQQSTDFNSIYKAKQSSFITAVIDEDVKGYLGSRIRIRLLEDIYVGTLKIKKGNYLYALISGFALQRVNLNIVSVMYQNEILPINLNIYDVDGMEGLYVPASAFREMTRKMGQSVVQGSSLNMQNADFFTNALSSLFQSTSQTVAALVRKNKVSVKYNSFIYLVDNKELQQRKQNIYKSTEE